MTIPILESVPLPRDRMHEFRFSVGLGGGENDILSLTSVCSEACTNLVAHLMRNYSFVAMTGQIPYLLLAGTVAVKAINNVVNMDKLMELIDDTIIDWMTEKPKEEIDILETYSKKTVTFSFIYAGSLWFISCMFCAIPASTHILDFLYPLNETRKRIFLYPAYFFLDEEKYYYLIITFEVVGSVMIVTVYAVTDVNFMSFVQHARALYTISGYRFKHAIEPDYVYYRINDPQKDQVYARLCRSIEIHKKVITFIGKIEASHDKLLFAYIGLIMLMIASTLLKVAEVEKNFEYVTFCAFMAIQLTNMYLLNSLGQWLKNTSDESLQAIWESLWYNASLKSQSLYLMVFQRCLSPPELTACGLVEMNLSTFVQVIKASFSYYTVMKPT
ncbi:uncharacterized protein LOC122395887 [Colletes gigas]|uniref:uncharacterized protein LOC122395887 n=1 Tax=Colletes gigas TaxID=935657 RepID=UPI001C9B8FDD|nr:uncharacterized protein LOC122395887 [Colletes gigas]